MISIYPIDAGRGFRLSAENFFQKKALPEKDLPEQLRPLYKHENLRGASAPKVLQYYPHKRQCNEVQK